MRVAHINYFHILVLPYYLIGLFSVLLLAYLTAGYACDPTVLKQPAVKRAVGIPETAHLVAPVTQAPTAAASIVTLNSPPKRSKKSKR